MVWSENQSFWGVNPTHIRSISVLVQRYVACKRTVTMAGAGGGAGGPGDKPVAMPVYGKTEYWDTRYTEDPEQ